MLDYAAFPEQRQALIRDLLLKEGRVVCVKLSQELQVSEHTIRRDLQELAQEGICKRVYGGAVSISHASPSFATRVEENNASKECLAKASAQLIRDGGCVFIDAGTTNLAIAKAIPVNLSLTVVTNSPAIALELMKTAKHEVVILGGRVQIQVGGALGITPLQQIENMYFDQCFLGACALDAVEGLTIFDHEDSEFKRAVAGRSNEIIVAMTSDKVPSIARYRVASCEDITTLVVEHDIPQEKTAPFLERGMDLRFAEQG
ncbi:DeoR/GlpR family DNA-binding transcription regulator [Uliginosibacterium gangwonense]|uniref:DeoR/GlpR family DNA-binding transcription regulator n=1 Tax=Uliginosibacterium gangwonense TaxID=392736 RepID=UPI00037AE9A8|nr:DeoR/GlpR family DNA-binding transcription regulator [Uliginosibacterium gangwonense]